MKVFAISDLHLSINSNKPMDIFGPVWDNYLEKIEKNWKNTVCDDDIVLIGGDISWAMKFENAIPDLQYISKFKGNKIIIKGNHDYWWNSISQVRENLPEKIIALQNDAVKIGNVIVAGSRGWSPADDGKETPENEKIYKRELIRMELSLKAAKKLQQESDTLIVLTHFPPMNNKFQKNEMTKLFESYKVDIVVFGHLHGPSPKTKFKFQKNNIKYFLSSCDLVNNKLIRII